MLLKIVLLTIFVNNVHSQISNAIEMIEEYKYPFENHSNIQTDDGYLLEMHRIPGRNVPSLHTKFPVFLMHGILDSSADWIVTGPGRALAYVLADLGYDVWMGNARGTTWSRKHVKYDPDNDRKFWDFSWHEIGFYDLPAMLDYVLLITEQESLYYIGVSQGGTVFFVMASERPEYNRKIRFAANLAPSVFTSTQSVLLRALEPIRAVLPFVTELLEGLEFMPHNPVFEKTAISFCNDFAPTCMELMQLTFGPNHFNGSFLPQLIRSIPSGSSANQILHYGQLIFSRCFCKYDYGSMKNLEKYNQTSPPRYDLSKVTAPVGLFYSLADVFVPAGGIKKLRSKLANVARYYQVPYDEFNHIDFLWATDVMPLLYDDLIRQLQKH